MRQAIGFVAVAVILQTASAQSATLRNVPADFPTIQAAINASVYQDTVMVAPGTYIENLDFEARTIRVLSSGGAGVTILRPALPGSTLVNFAGGGSETEFAGFTLDGGDMMHVILIGSGSQPWIHHNIIKNHLSYLANATEIGSYSGLPIISYNLFIHNRSIGGVGIFSGGGQILNNTFHDCSRGYWSQGSGVIAKNNIVTNSVQFGVADNGFVVSDYNCVFNNNPNYDYGAVPGANDIQVWPFYCDSSADDFTLDAISPCASSGEAGADRGAYGVGCGTEPGPRVLSLTVGGVEEGRVTAATPDFSWIYYDPDGMPQAETEIEVGTDSDWSVAEMWDAGPFAGIATTQTYAGTSLVDGTNYYARVRVSNGVEWGVWSTVDFFFKLVGSLEVPADYPSIQAAIVAAVDGDTVVVAPGTYSENISLLGKALHIVGSGGAHATVLTPALPDATLVEITQGEPTGTELSGFTFSGGSMKHMILVSNGSHPWIHNCVIRNHLSYEANATEIGSYSSDPLIQYNLFIRNRSLGAVGVFSGDGQILNNTFHDCSRGFWSQGDDVIAKNNIVTNSVEFGIGDNSFSMADYNCVFNNNPDYDFGAIPGPNDIQLWPVYCDTTMENFGLDAISPCAASGATGGDRGAFAVGCGTEPGPRVLSLALSSAQGVRITDDSPDITWTYHDPDGLPQAESEIEVGTDSDWSIAEMWDPLAFAGSSTSQGYAGSNLVPEQSYFARVRVSNSIQWGPWTTIYFFYSPLSQLEIPGEFPTIQAAIGAAIDGDTVLVTPGTYTENISLLGKRIHLIGSGGAESTVLSPATPTTTLVNIAQSEPAGTEITGFTFSGGSMKHSILVANGAEPWIHHCVVINHVSYEYNATEIGSYASVPVIDHNLFVHNRSLGGVGIFSGDGQLLNNTFHDCSRGFWSQGNNVIAKNNIVTNSVQFGIGDISFSEADYNCVFNNNPDYDFGAVPGAHDISAPPEYCDEFSDDYGLDVISPCAGSGEGGADRGAYGVSCGTGTAPRVHNLTVSGAMVMHVIDDTPEISWTYFDPGGIPQAEAEIEVGKDSDWSVIELWDPPPFAGTSAAQTYAGGALADGTTYNVRVRVSNGTEWSAWSARSFHTNTPPPAPTPTWPADSATVDTAVLVLQISKSPDAEGDAQSIEYAVYADEALTQLIVTADSQGASWQIAPPLTLENQVHWWRARANDGFEDGPWSVTRSFVLDAIDSPPLDGQLLSPVGNVAVPTTAPFLDWSDGLDPDPAEDIISYTVFIATDSLFVFSTQWSNLPTSSFVYSGLSVAQRYWWKVRYTEDDGPWSETAAERFFVPGPGDMNMNMSLNLVDVVMLIDVIFRGVPAPMSPYLADVNGDCVLNVADVVILIGHVFRNGPLPLAVCTPASTALRVPTQYPTITAAIGAASDDDTILVAAGTFVENLDFMGKRVSLLSEDGPEVTTLVPAIADQPTMKFVSGEDGTEVAGFTLSGGDGQHAILITNNSTPNIHHNIVRDHISYTYNATAIGSYSSSPVIEFNLFYHTRSLGGIGIFSGGGTIQNNTFDDNSRGYWSQGVGVIARSNIVTNSTDFGIGDVGFAVNDYNCTYNNNVEYCCGAVPGPNDFTADPLYCNPGGFNYNLAPGSLCIASGFGGVDRGAFPAGCLVR